MANSWWEMIVKLDKQKCNKLGILRSLEARISSQWAKESVPATYFWVLIIFQELGTPGDSDS